MTIATLAVDIVLLGWGNDGWHVLLIRRCHAPFEGCWALPGGRLSDNEEPAAAAIRELQEETGLLLPDTAELLGVYGASGRDPRGRVVSWVYLAVFDEDLPTPQAGTDAAATEWRPLTTVMPDVFSLAFDHGQILVDALARFEEIQE